MLPWRHGGEQGVRVVHVCGFRASDGSNLIIQLASFSKCGAKMYIGNSWLRASTAFGQDGFRRSMGLAALFASGT
jgi:hypothetical protein